MELKTRRWFYLLTLLWVVLLLVLGSWWLYLVFNLHSRLSGLHLPQLGDQERFLNMMRWEGSFFFLLLLMLGGSLFYMYWRDMKKSRGLQAFFASLSHELKTPLASMRLQAEVIKELIEDENHSHAQLASLTTRLIQDTETLESEFEKTLQLSRVEQDAPLNLVAIDLNRYLKREAQRLLPLSLDLSLEEGADEIMADELALKVVLRNLFENTRRHNPGTKGIRLVAKKTGNMVELHYDDLGQRFAGNSAKLGELFYKHNSAKGSGLGLYLIRHLMQKMKGSFEIENNERLTFRLRFEAPHE